MLRRPVRTAFTLVELLVVIAIIAILVGLISAAVVKALQKGNEAANAAEVRKLAGAVQAFETQYKVPYIPSRIVLCKYLAHYDLTNPLHKDSLSYLNQVWPRLQWNTKNATGQLLHIRIDWNGTTGGGGTGITTPPAANATNVFTLDGGKCLIFFLGGIPDSVSVGTTGFSTNPANPTVGAERVSPFYDFKANRLWNVGGFFYYRDVYGTRPYAYFSSYGKRNGYNRYYPNAATRSSDCTDAAVYGQTIWPLAELVNTATPRYPHPDSFQIISAGANETFGPGTAITGYNATTGVWSGINPWTYRTPGAAYTGTTAGADDQSNFHSLMLGVPAE